MTTYPSKASEPKSPLPTRLILAVVTALGLVILASGIYTCTTFLKLESSYLSNRGREISAVLESQARGSGRRNNPEFWQTLLDAEFRTYSGSAAFLALADANGNVLASAGTLATRDGVQVFEEALGRPRNIHSDPHPAASGWKIRIGLRLSQTDFIKRQAVLQLGISTLAAVVLFALSMILLRMLNRFLELKVRQGAEEQLKALGTMAASLAHEIRNPLGAMKGLTQLAQEDLPAGHAAQPHLKTVVSEAERLEKLVTNLLDFARPKEPQISEFDLAGLVSEIEAMLHSRLQSSAISLKVTVDSRPFYVQSDPSGLRQVLFNLLINAIDATPPGGHIALNAAERNDSEEFVIRVEDSGKGLGIESPEKLFQPFVSGKARGTGLGLAVSRQIVNSLGGTLTLENRAQGGTRGLIVLPKAEKVTK